MNFSGFQFPYMPRHNIGVGVREYPIPAFDACPVEPASIFRGSRSAGNKRRMARRAAGIAAFVKVQAVEIAGAFLRCFTAGAIMFSIFISEAAAVTQIQKESFAENQATAETNADSEKKADHWRREIGGEEFVNVHVAYSFCIWFALGVVFGFAVWCVPNLIVFYIDFKRMDRTGRR